MLRDPGPPPVIHPGRIHRQAVGPQDVDQQQAGLEPVGLRGKTLVPTITRLARSIAVITSTLTADPVNGSKQKLSARVTSIATTCPTPTVAKDEYEAVVRNLFVLCARVVRPNGLTTCAMYLRSVSRGSSSITKPSALSLDRTWR